MTENNSQIPFGRFLKFWREVRELSQEELAHRLDISSRHLSRLENGSCGPSKAIVQDIVVTLELGQRDRNYLLMSAGYTIANEKLDFHSPELKWLRKAMTLTLRSLDPYPASLMDRLGNLLMVNRGWVGFFRKNISQPALEQVTNQYDFLFSRQMTDNVTNAWEDTLSVILMSLKQSMMLADRNEEGQALLDRLTANPLVPDDWARRAAKIEPMASFRVQVAISGSLRTFYNVAQTVGAMGPAAYVSEPHLSINTLYPEDDDVDLSSSLESELSHPLLLY